MEHIKTEEVIVKGYHNVQCVRAKNNHPESVMIIPEGKLYKVTRIVYHAIMDKWTLIDPVEQTDA